MKHLSKLILWSFIVVGLVSCSSTSDQNASNLTSPTPAIYKVLPHVVENLIKRNYRVYDQPELGYSIHYEVPYKVLADVYIYPLPENQMPFSNKDIVVGNSAHAIQEILHFEKKGVYKNVKVLDQAGWGSRDDMLLKTELTFLAKGQDRYSLIYFAQHMNSLVKIRMTMDNHSVNRQSGAWDNFAKKLMKQIGTELRNKQAKRQETRGY
ncbi:hypothetical protein [Algibacillus agarilyticus]|uniref:hypothetical protein n=1 Tax=Algibacillus agarilyticus TaxID=2234133 RepID=UPI000DD07E84|nr:hypothetical protein [Algibacillus agarilyticus]